MMMESSLGVAIGLLDIIVDHHHHQHQHHLTSLLDLRSPPSSACLDADDDVTVAESGDTRGGGIGRLVVDDASSPSTICPYFLFLLLLTPLFSCHLCRYMDREDKYN